MKKNLPDRNPTNISCCYKACCCKSHLYVKTWHLWIYKTCPTRHPTRWICCWTACWYMSRWQKVLLRIYIIHLSIKLYIRLPIHTSIHPFSHVFIHPFLYSTIHPSNHTHPYVNVMISRYLWIHVSISMYSKKLYIFTYIPHFPVLFPHN